MLVITNLDESQYSESFCPIKCESVKISQIIQFPRLPLDPYYKLLFKLFHQLSNWQTSSEKTIICENFQDLNCGGDRISFKVPKMTEN